MLRRWVGQAWGPVTVTELCFTHSVHIWSHPSMRRTGTGCLQGDHCY